MEEQILSLINKTWTSPGLDLFMAVFSSMDFWLWPLIVLGLAVAIRGGFRARTLLVVIAVIVGLLNALVDVAKRQVHRPRPNDALVDVRIVRLAKVKPALLAIAQPAVVTKSQVKNLKERGVSFPSGHTANNFAAAALVAAFYRRFGWLAFIPAALVGYSRIYTGSHWPSDVLVTALLATGLAWLLLALAESAWERWAPRWLPRLAAAHPRLREGAGA